MIALEENFGHRAKIKVIGVGGGGGNAISTMVEASLAGAEFIAANTDAQALDASRAAIRMQLGKELTRGLGCGGNPEMGRNAAREDYERMKDILSGADMVFITAGMGGGTGTGAAPVIGELVKELGALSVGVVTRPFDFEGPKRKKQAEDGIKALAACVDTLIVIPNQKLLALASKNTTLKESFRKADEVLLQAVRGITDLIMVPGLVNLDFADVRAIMTGMGMAVMGTGTGVGEERTKQAAETAISSPLLDDLSISGAKGILLNITGGSDLSIQEVETVAGIINQKAMEGGKVADDLHVIWGTVFNDNMNGEIRVTVIATGFGNGKQKVTEVRNSPRKEPGPFVESTSSKYDLPTFLRKEKKLNVPDPVTINESYGSRAFEEDEYDIPAYIRKNGLSFRG
ncbi:MAG: cell division protein FtsZ [Proteobacteria bacterium]|nr:cell division protein FtsZ [Pseudomonadota bacterium]